MEKAFEKIIKNLDEKIVEINKFKKEVNLYKEYLANKDEDSRKSLSDDPFGDD